MACGVSIGFTPRLDIRGGMTYGTSALFVSRGPMSFCIIDVQAVAVERKSLACSPYCGMRNGIVATPSAFYTCPQCLLPVRKHSTELLRQHPACSATAKLIISAVLACPRSAGKRARWHLPGASQRSFMHHVKHVVSNMVVRGLLPQPKDVCSGLLAMGHNAVNRIDLK